MARVKKSKNGITDRLSKETSKIGVIGEWLRKLSKSKWFKAVINLTQLFRLVWWIIGQF